MPSFVAKPSQPVRFAKSPAARPKTAEMACTLAGPRAQRLRSLFVGRRFFGDVSTAVRPCGLLFLTCFFGATSWCAVYVTLWSRPLSSSRPRRRPRLGLGCQGTIEPAWHPRRSRRTAIACDPCLVIGRRERKLRVFVRVRTGRAAARGLLAHRRSKAREK